MWDKVTLLTFAQYKRRVDAFEFRSKLRGVPRDGAALLALARDIELEDRIILDRTDNAE